MKNAWLLVSIASAVLTCAPAQAAILGGCPSPLRPPPCIIIDPSKIIATLQEIRQKQQELQQLQQTLTEFRSMTQGLGSLSAGGFNFGAPRQPLLAGRSMSLAAGTNLIIDTMVPAGQLDEGQLTAARNRIGAAARSTHMDAYALSLAMKNRLSTMAREATAIERRIAASTDQRTDWQANTQAQLLVYQALAAKREVENMRLALSASQISTNYRSPGGRRAVAQPLPAAQVPAYGAQLTALTEASQRVQLLQEALRSTRDLQSARSILNNTVTEYNGVRQEVTNTNSRLMASALETARLHNSRTGRRMSQAQIQAMANSIAAAADRTMQQRDRTGWADTNKGPSQEAASRQAFHVINRMVEGNPANGLRDRIIAQTEARKMEAFFRPIAQDAQKSLQDLDASTAQLAQQLGLPNTSPQTIQQALNQAQAQFQQSLASLQTAPADVQSIADRIRP